jgi:hypothetical protein
MANLKLKATVDIRKMDRYRSIINKQLRLGTGEIGKAYTKWGVRIRGFLRRRFKRLSKGGGEWPPITLETARAKGFNDILVETGTIYSKFAFGRKSIVSNYIRSRGLRHTVSISVFTGGDEPHPKGNGVTTVSDIVGYHQTGAGNLPVRKVVVPPTEQIQRGMAADMQSAVDRIADKTGR